MEKFKVYGVQAVSGLAVAFTGKNSMFLTLLVLFASAMVIDYLSGMAASAKEAIENPEDKEKGLQSKKGVLGLLKKTGYILIVLAAVMVDVLIYLCGDILGFAMPTDTFFSIIITTMLLLNEILSITENAGRMGATVPAALTKVITVLKNQTEKKGEEKS